MSLEKLNIQYVRNIQQLTLIPSPKLNFFYGANGSGKTALLEAIYLLGRAKSFRLHSVKSVIQFQRDYLLVSGQLTTGSARQLGVRLDGKQVELRINQQTTLNRADLAHAFPLLLIHPKTFLLLDTGSKERREFLDWGVFHDIPLFFDAWRHCKRLLLHRNAVLKTKKLQQLATWDKELADYGTIVADYRHQYLNDFLPIFLDTVNRFLGMEDLTISLTSGWDKSKTLAQALQEDRERDLRDGFTHSGPHRADLQITHQQRKVKDFFSRGQLKLLILSLKLAQMRMFSQRIHHDVCILIDDFAAELDLNNRKKLLDYLADLSCQAFITTNERVDFGDISRFSDCKIFHLEQGVLSSK